MESPLKRWLVQQKSGTNLRTGYTHFYRMNDGVDRSTAHEFRLLCRSGQHLTHTVGHANGFVQANFVALPQEHAFEFLTFCLRNPKACPLLAVTDPGDPVPRNIAPLADIRSDIPKYRVYRHGKLTEELSDITELWTEDMVGFLLGCSFSWEQTLADAGFCPRQVEQERNVPMFRTQVPNVASGRFKGSLVVSMRPYMPEDAPKVAEITEKFPGAHGDPIHWGNAAELGIPEHELEAPHYGDAVEIRDGEVPVFWACGVTPQTAILEANIPLAITHSPGHMFVTDILDSELRVG